jgi:DNA-directed RNA polymerase specialized sigma24 family protein
MGTLAMCTAELLIHQESTPEAFQVVVMHALELRPVFRNIFLLCEIQEFSIDQAASILGISSEAARLRLNRARRELSIRMRAES